MAAGTAGCASGLNSDAVLLGGCFGVSADASDGACRHRGQTRLSRKYNIIKGVIPPCLVLSTREPRYLLIGTGRVACYSNKHTIRSRNLLGGIRRRATEKGTHKQGLTFISVAIRPYHGSTGTGVLK